jgi:cobalt/nickel transport system permease protein
MMLNESFAGSESVVHRIDPRFRMAAATALSFVIAVLKGYPSLVLSVVIGVVMVCAAGLDVWAVTKRVRVVLGFVLLMWAVLPLTYEGEILFRMGPFPVMRPGVDLAGQITLKSMAMTLIFISLVATMPIAAMGYALSRLRVPDKMVYLLLITYRYFFVLAQEHERLVRAAKMRGFRPKTNMHTYRTYAYLLGMLFVRASARAKRVYQAMRCRGFSGKFYTLVKFSAHPRNAIFSVLMILLSATLIFFEWSGR